MYRVEVSPKAQKQLKIIIKVTKKEYILQFLEDLKTNPFIGKPLERNLVGKYMYRTGVYRVIYRIKRKEKLVEIITVGHRSNVYQ